MKQFEQYIVAFSLFLVLLTGLYLFFITVVGRVRQKRVNYHESRLEPVSIIIAAYNEEIFIRDKILYFLAKDEWIPGSEIIIISAGSTDLTNSILKELGAMPEVKITILDEFMVKPQALNRAVQAARHEILVFSDCRQKIRAGSLRRLILNFSDASIGTVNSTLIDLNRKGKGSFLRNALNTISIRESTFGSSLNVYGAFYAQRRSVFRPFPEDILFDDLYVIASTLAQRKRLIQESEAVIYDMGMKEYYTRNRIERLARGLLIFLFAHPRLILQMPLAERLRFLMFKYFKLLMPYMILMLMIVVGDACYEMPLVFLCTLPTIAALLYISRIRQLVVFMARVNFYFVVATVRFLFLNGRDISWQKLDNRQVTGYVQERAEVLSAMGGNDAV